MYAFVNMMLCEKTVKKICVSDVCYLHTLTFNPTHAYYGCRSIFSQVFPLFLSYSLRGYFILLFILFFCLKSVFIFHKLLILLFLFSWILLYSLTTTTHLQRFLLRLYVKHALSCHVFLFNTLSFVFISFYYKTNSDS